MYTLVLILANAAGLTSTPVPQPRTETQCAQVGEAWKAQAKKLQGSNLAQYVCLAVPQEGPGA